jgi:hypothetical protein
MSRLASDPYFAAVLKQSAIIKVELDALALASSCAENADTTVGCFASCITFRDEPAQAVRNHKG